MVPKREYGPNDHQMEEASTGPDSRTLFTATMPVAVPEGSFINLKPLVHLQISF
jgi:hypothetical protein